MLVKRDDFPRLETVCFCEDFYGKRGPCFEFAGHVDRIADERDLSGDCSMTW